MKPWIVVIFLVYLTDCSKSTQSRTITQWAPFAEWTISNVTWSGNPFDVVAEVIFRHIESGETRTTQMFCIDDKKWSFRFSGTSPGMWQFVSKSEYKNLDGLRGQVTVIENPDSKTHGFLKSFIDSTQGTKWGWTGTETTFSPQYVMWHEGKDISADSIDAEIDLWLKQHGFAGLHIPVKEPDVWTNGENPNLTFFEILETIITKVHAAGGACHIWFWGDESRGQVPPGGINSLVDKRLQRYICARLGPIPGWSASYGFDLFEWVSGEQLDEWYDYMHEHLGWFHFLGARTNKHGEFELRSEKMDYASYELHKYDPPQPWYLQWRKVMTERAGKPAFSEDRFRVRGKYPKKDVTEEETRRGLYYATMAGGAASIWGYLKNSDGTYKSGGRSFKYPHPEWIKTWSRFFHDKNRFTPDLQASNPNKNVYILKNKKQARIIIYSENTSSIPIDLQRMSNSTINAVDTQKTYSEIPVKLDKNNIITLPYSSDWILAIKK